MSKPKCPKCGGASLQLDVLETYEDEGVARMQLCCYSDSQVLGNVGGCGWYRIVNLPRLIRAYAKFSKRKAKPNTLRAAEAVWRKSRSVPIF